MGAGTYIGQHLFVILVKEYRQVFETLDQNSMREFIELIKKHDRIFCIGVGREGMMTRAFAMRLMHMGKEVHWIWDDTTPHIGKGDLLIATLGDGSIGHIDYVCRRAKEAGACIVERNVLIISKTCMAVFSNS